MRHGGFEYCPRVCPRFAVAPLSGLPAPGRRVFFFFFPLFTVLPFADWRFMTARALTLARASAVSRAGHYLSRITVTPHLFLAVGSLQQRCSLADAYSHLRVRTCTYACMPSRYGPEQCTAYSREIRRHSVAHMTIARTAFSVFFFLFFLFLTLSQAKF